MGKSNKKDKRALPQAEATPAEHDSSPPAAKKRKLEHEDEGQDENEDVGVPASDGLNGSADLGLTKAAKAKAKKKRKEEQRALENPPTFSFDTRGFKGCRSIAIKDVRDFVLHLLSDEKAQQWLYVANKRNVRRVVAVMIPGITPPTIGVPVPPLSANLPFSIALSDSSTSKLPIFQTLFSHACPTKAPGEKNRMHSCYQAFTTCPLTGGEKDRREKARKEMGQLEKTTDPTVYIMSREQMTENMYPEPSPPPSSHIALPTFADWQKADGWIEAPFAPPQPGRKKLFALDCEMVLTENGSELARISVVDAKGVSVYDSLVKPEKPVLDYLTKFSGLNAGMLKDVATRLSDVQARLAELIDYNSILLGHSLESDLRVLRLTHRWVIDTSVLYQHPRGPPFKASLRWLAQKWLNKEIQSVIASDAVVGGHDSEEDAKTCIELLDLKMQKGATFGEFVTDQETVFERIARGPEPKSSAVVDHGTPGQWHGAKAKTAISCSDDNEVLQGILESVDSHDFVMARFMDLSQTLGWSSASTATSLPGIPSSALATPTPSTDTSNPTSTEVADSALLSATLSALNTQLATLHAALPPLTAFVVFTGHSDPREMARLSAKKAKFDRLWKTVKQSEIAGEDRWMESDDRQLVDEVERCRAGTAYFCIKT